mmetsp:Transcript_36438/g.116796  ORF Transcript_36438/g.116796 Transcript_36438/m.116796 type:complete len:141 (+) Transcript_36438:1-423(+)
MDDSAEEICVKLVDFLAESKVPERHLEPLRKLAEENDAEELLERAEELGYCMAYMDHEQLVRLLASGWKAHCASKQVLRKKAFRVCARIEADTKADTDELDEARRKRDDLDRACAKSNLTMYKMQVLKASYDDDDKGKSD